MSFEIKAEGVDVERLLAEIQRRVEERRGRLYTEEELRYIAERPLEGVVQPHDVRADLLDEFRKRDASWNYSFDARDPLPLQPRPRRDGPSRPRAASCGRSRSSSGTRTP